MKRIATILGVFLVALAVIVAAAVHWLWKPAVKMGLERHWGAEVIARNADHCPTQKPLVFWMGDSTFWPAKGHPMYPQLIQAETRPTLHHCIVAHPGLDYFNFYAMMGKALEHRADLVISVANLRIFEQSRDDTIFRDQVATLPVAELPRAMTLPLYARDLTVPRLLLNRALLAPGFKQSYFFLEGLRVLFQESGRWDALAPRKPPLSTAQHRRRPLLKFMSTYDVELTAGHPVVQMMGETVRVATEHHVKSLVIVIPIPYQELARVGLYDGATYVRRVDVLRQEVIRRGGCLIDLHAALSTGEFVDFSGHYKPRGAAHLRDLVKPAVLHMMASDRGGCPVDPGPR